MANATRIDIFSGFLGAGKTTLIRKLIQEGYQGEKLVLIENDFGEIAIDGGFLKDAGVQITEMNSGCICCTLVGDFAKALKKVIDDFTPDRILIEPSGVGKLSEVATAIDSVEGAMVGAKVTVVNAEKCRMYMRNFGEFFNNQVAHADLVVMSRTDTATEEALMEATEVVRELNPEVSLMTTPWDKLTGKQILEAMESNGLHNQMFEMEHEHEHHHDHECCCGHDHDHDHECCCGHDHEHGEECTCGCHDHDHHHHHHHADEVFGSWGMETPKKFGFEQVEKILHALDDKEKYGFVLRAKGFVDAVDGGEWIYFDYVPGEVNVRRGGADVTGRFCVIGSQLDKQALKELFELD